MNALVSRMNKTLVRREFWENRSLWVVPAVVIGILTVLSLYMLIAVVVGHSQTVNTVDTNGMHFRLDNLPDFANAEPQQVVAFIRASTFMLGFMFSSIMKIVLFFYLLDSLYAERRDRSILFWRSMPVSDTRTVLSKLATALFSFTGITLAATIVLQLILLLFTLIMGAALGVHAWSILAYPGSFIGSWVYLAYGLVAQAIWFLPFFGWVMLASAWAKKAPFLWAVLVPLGLMGAEGWVFHSANFARLIFRHSLNWIPLAFNFDMDMNPKPQIADLLNNNVGLVTFASVGRFLTNPELWIGTALAAVFIYGAIWLRRNRSEI
jgi:ABC-2 type transport system permease protein